MPDNDKISSETSTMRNLPAWNSHAKIPGSSEPLCQPDRMARNSAGQPLLTLPPHWRGLPLGVFPIPAKEERGPTHAPHSMILLVLKGTGRRWYRSGARTRELSTVPQQMDVIGRDFERDYGRWDGQDGLTVAVHLRDDVVERLTHDTGFEIRTTHEVFDGRLAWLIEALHDDAQRGSPGGHLFSEGLSIALVGRLREHYGCSKRTRTRSSSLTGLQQQRIRDYVAVHRGANLSITHLAGEVGMTPERFVRAFKASFGSTPSRWLQECKMKEGIRLLKTTSRPIVDVALELGFCSQSHFTHAFRQATGMTPARVRSDR